MKRVNNLIEHRDKREDQIINRLKNQEQGKKNSSREDTNRLTAYSNQFKHKKGKPSSDSKASKVQGKKAKVARQVEVESEELSDGEKERLRQQELNDIDNIYRKSFEESKNVVDFVRYGGVKNSKAAEQQQKFGRLKSEHLPKGNASAEEEDDD